MENKLEKRAARIAANAQKELDEMIAKQELEIEKVKPDIEKEVKIKKEAEVEKSQPEQEKKSEIEKEAEVEKSKTEQEKKAQDDPKDKE